MTKKRFFTKKSVIIFITLVILFTSAASRGYQAPRIVGAEADVFIAQNINEATRTDTREADWLQLDALNICLTYRPAFEPVPFTAFLTTGQGNFWQQQKAVMTSASYNVVLTDFYNQISGGVAGEAVLFTTSSKLIISDAFGVREAMVVLDFDDTQNNTTNYIVQFMDLQVNDTVYFKDILINGEPFPENESSANFQRYQFHGVTLYLPYSSNAYRANTFLPFCTTFYRWGGLAYEPLTNAYLMFTALNLYDYPKNTGSRFRFDTLFGQISTVTYNSSTNIPTQQAAAYFSSDTFLEIVFTPTGAAGTAYYVFEDEGTVLMVDDSRLYLGDVDDLETFTETTTYALEFNADSYVNIYNSINVGAEAINVVDPNATGYAAVDLFLSQFHAFALINTFQPAPEPEPEPEPEPQPTPEEKLKDALEWGERNWGWGLAATLLFGGVGTAIFLAVGGFVNLAAVEEYNLTAEPGETLIETIARIGENIRKFLINLATTLGAVFRGFLDGITGGSGSTFGKIIVIVGIIIFTVGNLGLFYYIFKKRKE